MIAGSWCSFYPFPQIVWAGDRRLVLLGNTVFLLQSGRPYEPSCRSTTFGTVSQLQEDWEWLLAHGMCLQVEADTSMRAVPVLQPCVLEEGFQCWLSSEIARVQVRKKKNLWLPGATDLGDEQLAHLDSMQRDLMQQALMRQIERVDLSGLEQFHLRLYRRIWKQLLIEWKMYTALIDLCEQFLTRLSVMTRQELWECAYYATDLSSWSYQNIAEKRYKEYLAACRRERNRGHPSRSASTRVLHGRAGVTGARPQAEHGR